MSKRYRYMYISKRNSLHKYVELEILKPALDTLRQIIIIIIIVSIIYLVILGQYGLKCCRYNRPSLSQMLH